MTIEERTAEIARLERLVKPIEVESTRLAEHARQIQNQITNLKDANANDISPSIKVGDWVSWRQGTREGRVCRIEGSRTAYLAFYVRRLFKKGQFGKLVKLYSWEPAPVKIERPAHAPK